MGTPLGPKYIPYTYMDSLGKCKAIGFTGQLQGVKVMTESIMRHFFNHSV